MNLACVASLCSTRSAGCFKPNQCYGKLPCLENALNTSRRKMPSRSPLLPVHFTSLDEAKWILAVPDSKADDRYAGSSAVQTASAGEKSYGSLQHEAPSHAAPSDRIVSSASTVSTLDKGIDSTGGDTILFSKEVTTGIFCANLFSYLISKIWGEIALQWVDTRPDTLLAWADS